jgi:hypothetical protein
MMNIKQYPIYENPYDALKIDPDTVLKLHAVPLGENELSPYITSLSPYTAKLQAYFRLFGIKHELVSEPIPDVGPRGKVPFNWACDICWKEACANLVRRFAFRRN